MAFEFAATAAERSERAWKFIVRGAIPRSAAASSGVSEKLCVTMASVFQRMRAKRVTVPGHWFEARAWHTAEKRAADAAKAAVQGTVQGSRRETYADRQAAWNRLQEEARAAAIAELMGAPLLGE